MRGKRLLSVFACSLGILLCAGNGSADAASSSVVDDKSVQSHTVVNIDRHKTLRARDGIEKRETVDEAATGAAVEERELSLQERIQRLLHPEQFQPPKPVVAMSSDDNMIMGGAVATQEQCVRYLLRNNPYPKLNVSPQELVAYYYEEGSRTGIRPDIAFAQALKETGYFSYGGTVVPAQNNYCGLGTTSATVRGAYFATPRLGVRAHIQHLLAYASTEKPDDNIVDPRYDLVRNSYGEKTLTRWQDLNGRWAVPGVGYGQSILNDYYRGIINS